MTNTLISALDVLTAREYRRVSLDRSGRQASVDQQGDANAHARERHGMACGGAPYVDNDRSASRYARQTRDDFTRLLTDLESGAFGANVLQRTCCNCGSRPEAAAEWASGRSRSTCAKTQA